MKKLTEYYDPSTTLSNNRDQLSDPALDFEKHRDEVNELVLNFVIKYLTEYLGITERNDVRKIEGEVRQIVCANDITPEHSLAEMMGMFAAKTKELLSGNFQDDLYPVECVIDLRSTAAIVKEIIFNDRFSSEEPFLSLDLGSGTGILLAASLIAARRKKIQEISGLGFELQEQAIIKSSKLLTSLFEKEQVNIERKDICDPMTYIDIYGFPIRSWISETISMGTPRIKKVGDDWQVEFRNEREAFFSQMEQGLDPFVKVFGASVSIIKDFENKVKNGQIAMFPDLINGLYRPDTDQSTLQFRTGLKGNFALPRAGEEFENFENFTIGQRGTRWGHDPELEKELNEIGKRIAKLFKS